MYHRQFKVRFGVINRYPAVFDKCDLDEQVHSYYAVDHHIIIPGDKEIIKYIREGCIAGKHCKGGKQYKKCRFHKHGKKGFTACAHALEAAAGIKGGNDSEELPERQHIGEKDKIALK